MQRSVGSLEKELFSWTLRTLNLVSKVTLIKYVLQPMPIYLLLVMEAPKVVPKEIRNIQRKFLWGCNADKKKWALVRWDNICKP